mgnify:CR=1 FL=1
MFRPVFLLLSCDMRFSSTFSDGDPVESGKTLLELNGSAHAILTGERTALNILSRMSGIATLTREFVAAIAGTKATILDTRKTAPGLRASTNSRSETAAARIIASVCTTWC